MLRKQYKFQRCTICFLDDKCEMYECVSMYNYNKAVAKKIRPQPKLSNCAAHSQGFGLWSTKVRHLTK